MRDQHRFRPGDRVRIDDVRYPTFWANGVFATIANPPRAILEFADGWAGHVRMVPTTSGVQPFYWVLLDEPRYDGDGDGPYREAEIAGQSLHLVVEH